MNNTTIESLLFRAPSPAAPADLLRRLQDQIALPQKRRLASDRSPAFEWRHPLRRWLPALAFGLFFLSCVILVGMHAGWISGLTQEREKLQVAASSLPDLREAQARWEESQLQLAELDRLRNDNEDLVRLRAEVEELRALPGRIEQLGAENRQLAAALVAVGSNEAFFDEAQKEAKRIACINNLKQLGLAARVWAGDEDGRYPTSLVVMSNEIASVQVLICPSDPAKQAYRNVAWPEFQDSMSSYPFYGTGGPDDTFPESILSKCPIHHNYGLADGSVHSINPLRVREVTRDGRRYLERMQSAPAGP